MFFEDMLRIIDRRIIIAADYIAEKKGNYVKNS
jgi:hypothetical protein